MSVVEPIAAFDPKGKAAVISYNVPEPSTFSGRNYIELDFGADVFETIAEPAASAAESSDKPVSKEHISDFLSGVAIDAVKVDLPLLNKGLRSREVLEAFLVKNQSDVVKMEAGKQEVIHAAVRPMQLEPDSIKRVETPVAHLLKREGMANVVSNIQQGGLLVEHTGLAGEPLLKSRVPGRKRTPRIAIVEEYRLSSFLGNYGASKTIKTLTLLPGEEQTIKVVSSTRTSTKASAGTSILDSYSQETGEEFTDQVQRENTARDTSSENFSYHAEAEASASWGWGKAKVSGGVVGETNASRENFGRNMSNATAKHIANASSERTIDIKTSEESSTESSFEEVMERTIKNVNLSRTMNFVFRSLVQEYITLLHLVDVRIAYHDTTEDSYVEVPLSELDSLLEGRVKPDRQKEVKQAIVDALSYISDYNDELHSFAETREIKANGHVIGSYLRAKKGKTSTYKDVTGNEITVPGIIISATKNTLKTQGVIVEALLGEGEALDEYSRGLQRNEVKRVDLTNQVIEAGLQILRGGDTEKANMFAAMFPQHQVLTDVASQ